SGCGQMSSRNFLLECWSQNWACSISNFSRIYRVAFDGRITLLFWQTGEVFEDPGRASNPACCSSMVTMQTPVISWLGTSRAGQKTGRSAPVLASYSEISSFTSSMLAVAGAYSSRVVLPWYENVTIL